MVSATFRAFVTSQHSTEPENAPPTDGRSLDYAVHFIEQIRRH
jgi:hypothetical protein